MKFMTFKSIFVFTIGVFAAFNAAAGTRQLTGLDLRTGKMVEVKPAKKGLVVVFMSAKCPCSNSHAPVLKQLPSDFKDFAFVGVHANSDEPIESAKTYFKALDLPFPVIEDSKDKIADEFKAYKTPHAFLMAPDGKILYKGGVTNSATAPDADKQFLRDALSDVEAGKPVRVAEGRTLGCVISR